MTETTTEESPEDLHQIGVALADGDRLRVNDRTRPFTVTGQHDREREKSYASVEQGDYVVTELEGNGTEYHLLCWENPKYGPMLYKESDWDVTETSDGDTRYEYPRGGDRVTAMELVE